MPFATQRHGHQIYYEVTGEQGPPVVLVMGIGISSRFWFDIPHKLAADPVSPRRVITVDNRGTGQTKLPRAPFAMTDLADDVAAVLDAAGIQKADVVGISLGGMIAQEVAIRHPDRVRGLVLLCTTPGFPLGTLPRPRAIRILVSGFLNGLTGPEFERLMAPEHRLAEARKARKAIGYAQLMRAELFDPRTLFYHLLAAGLHSSALRLSRIQCPTMIVTGDDDMLIPKENSLRLARAIPHARLRVLPEVGHDILTLEPSCVAEALKELDLLAPTAS